jgi:hypothetical protein
MTALKLSLAALLALGAFATSAHALDFAAGGQPKLKAVAAQLGIISPPDFTCPGNAKLTAWITTNKPGTIDIMIVRKGGSVAGPYPVTTVAAANGKAMGSYTKLLNIVQPVDAEYRVVIGNSTVASNWAPLAAVC